jgi:hypothetical protein
MLSPEEVPTAVQEDVERGLGEFFEPHSDDFGDGWTEIRDFKDQGAITNGSFTTVAWEYRCLHTGWFQFAPPSNTVLTIRGATIVDHREEEAVFHRNVDWLAVMYDIGYDLYLRKLVEEPDRDAINWGPDGPPAG